MVDTVPNWYERYNASYIISVRVKIPDVPGSLASVLSAAAEEATQIGNIRLVGVEGEHKIRDVEMFFDSADHMNRSLAALKRLDRVEVLSVTDDVLEIHRGGTIETRSRVRLESLMDLRMVYTPGVASVCQLIAAKPAEAWNYTAVGNKIAIVTNGTAVLGIGDIGLLAALPVMEGKAAILSRFVGVSAEPMLIDSKDTDEIVDIVAKTSAGYGAVQIEDIAAPSCFEIERKLQARIDKPVFHDDQHGTATVCVAGLISALRQVGKRARDVSAVVLGAGAAGSAIARILNDFGVADVVLCDSTGAIYRGRTEGMNDEKLALAEITNKDNVKGGIGAAIRGRHLFVGVSRPRMITPDMVRSMAKDPIVFALANPVSEISVQEARAAGAAVALDGRGMNNALAYPGIFRGALDARAKRITKAMMLAAARAIAEAAGEALLPDMLDLSVHERVTRAVASAWEGRWPDPPSPARE